MKLKNYNFINKILILISCIYLLFKIFCRLKKPLEAQKIIFFEKNQSFLVNFFAKNSTEIILIVAIFVMLLITYRYLKKI